MKKIKKGGFSYLFFAIQFFQLSDQKGDFCGIEILAISERNIKRITLGGYYE